MCRGRQGRHATRNVISLYMVCSRDGGVFTGASCATPRALNVEPPRHMPSAPNKSRLDFNASFLRARNNAAEHKNCCASSERTLNSLYPVLWARHLHDTRSLQHARMALSPPPMPVPKYTVLDDSTWPPELDGDIINELT